VIGRSWFVACAVALTAAGCRPPQPPDEGDYATREAARRAAIDQQFQTESIPVPENRKAHLLPLVYFPIDPAYNVPAALKPFENVSVVEMMTSTGTVEKFRRVGTLEFTLKGQPLSLTAFVSAASPNVNRLFVPFNDLTSGTETYGAGRYLDLDRTASGSYNIDFNIAYNPYCYYNPTYVCPLPPPENRLKVRIEAGEKIRS
jgi:uncharacterized protein (DUF1684 family)